MNSWMGLPIVTKQSALNVIGGSGARSCLLIRSFSAFLAASAKLPVSPGEAPTQGPLNSSCVDISSSSALGLVSLEVDDEFVDRVVHFHVHLGGSQPDRLAGLGSSGVRLVPLDGVVGRLPKPSIVVIRTRDAAIALGHCMPSFRGRGTSP